MRELRAAEWWTWAEHYRTGNCRRAKTKRAGAKSRPLNNDRGCMLFALGWGQVDAGNGQGVTFYRHLHGNMMAGVGRPFVLVSDGIHFLVSIVHEDELRAFLYTFRRTFLCAFVRSLRAAFA